MSRSPADLLALAGLRSKRSISENLLTKGDKRLGDYRGRMATRYMANVSTLYLGL